MSKKVTPWLDNLLQEIEGIEIRRKDSRRVRIDIAADSLPTLLELLRGRAGYVHLSAITCVDWIDESQFELVYQLWSYESQSLVSAHIRIARDPGVYVSVFDLYQPAAFFERDIHEMFGVYFEGSPDMSKFILTEWNGPPPMRKEFDAEAWVNETFERKEYQPDWLKEITEQGGGIVKSPEEARQKKP
ncbi:MAG: NADH-quinone oxidoreductase subunit C [gamma proteobacterium endosymbiont of Lamellibrachia anaximandri]|nr:NADH-quinone oxidoreductase subunit C [gamma proteobacterium endosymbiont of Lamellibrachia anaximandri]MBL3618955.1 NADH-quinone oxidoreductase subunit C [gamma proteobacterium endosymbiont of Lamellibrachia anaximandri]